MEHTSLKKRLYRQWIDLLWIGALRRYRAENPIVIAVGGSVGKTSTKEAVALMLQETDHPVEKTHGNMATDSGVPLSLLGMKAPPSGIHGRIGAVVRSLTKRASEKQGKRPYYVLEYSSDVVGDTAFLTGKIAPDIAILTTIVPVHMYYYKTEEAMVEETVSLVDAVPAGGKILANADDPHQVKTLSARDLQGREILWYGISGERAKTSVYADHIEANEHGLSVEIGIKTNDRSETIRCTASVIATYQLYSLLAATAVAIEVGLTSEQIKHALESYDLPAGRGRIIEGIRGITIIDDSANAASPDAVIAGLSALADHAKRQGKRPVAILGTMAELGDMSDESHIRVGKHAAQSVEHLIAIGPFADRLAEGARLGGLSHENIRIFTTPEEVLQAGNGLLRDGDAVIVKASQNGMRFERIVKAFMLHPEQAGNLLVRQEAYWNH